MKKLFTLAASAALLTGCDFIGGSDVDPVAFSSVTITEVPLPREEDGTRPDLYVEIQDASGRAVYEAPSILEDAEAAAFPYEMSTGGELVGSTRSYFLVVMDRDADGNDLIALSEPFSADDLRASTEPTFAVANEAGSIQAVITISQ